MNPTLEMLLLVVWANGIPVLACPLLGRRFRYPLDGGRLFRDGRPLLGPSKTWCGVGAAVLTTPLIATIFGLSWVVGLIAAVGAMLGDSIASFIKRRTGRASGEAFLFLDQIPESLIPVLLLQGVMGLSLVQVAVVVIGFAVINLALTPLAGRVRGIAWRILARSLRK
jgi:CDP-diglyceride synthetase